MRKLCFISTLVVLTLLVGKTAYTQDFSNKGKDFYLCFPQHVQSSNLATLSIWITSDKASSGTITMPNSAFNATFNIAAFGIQEIQVPYAAAHIPNNESTNATVTRILKKSLRIKTDPGKPPVVAYAQQWAGARSAATLVLPVNVLGKKYYSMSFTQTGSNNGTALARSQFQVIAVKDNTVVTITPRKNGVVGTPFTVTLPTAGDMIQYQSEDGAAMTQDLTGTYIESIASATGGCNPIAVFSGSSNITMGTPSCSGGSFDPLFQQCYPISSWGKNFGFVPFADYANGVPYRVLASENNTSVFFDGALVAVLNAGEIYPSIFTQNPPVLTAPTAIKADKPICVAEYAQAMNCAGPGASVGDPDMVILNPIEQNISDITIFSSNLQAISKQWVNVVMKTIAIPTFTINGVVPTSNPWLPFTSMPGYSYIKCLLPGIGSYRLKSDSGFNAICYGWGNVESYAYSAGTNVKDNYRVIGTATPYGGAGTPTLCLNTPSKLKISLPYKVDSMYWDFYGAQPNVWIKPPPPVLEDSTTTVSGLPVYWYSVGPMTFTTPGSYPVTITTYAPNTDGCGSEQDIDFDIEVIARPQADFTFITTGCVTSPVLFTDNSTTNGRPVSSRYWDFGDLTNTNTNNPSHTYAASGSYIVKYTLINDIGCISDTMPHTVTLSDPPVADFTSNAPYCEGKTIQFTDASSVTPGNTITTWTWNFGDPASGGNNTSTLQNPSHVFASAGLYNVTLLVETATGCQSFLKTIPVTIHANPVANFTMPTAVCLPAGLANFTDNSTVASGESISIWAWDFGDPPSGANNNSALQNPSHVYPIAQPYTINLQITTANGCEGTKAQILNTINVEPTALFTAPAEACAGSLIGFPDNSIAPGSAVTVWHWDFGDPASGPNNTSALQNPTHIFATPGSYTVTLSITSAAGCQSLTASHIASHNIIVKALPTLGISGSTTVCLNSTPLPTVSFMAAGGTGPYQVTYKIGVTGPPVTIPTDASGFASIQIPTNVPGNVHVELVSVVEGGPAHCSQNQTGFVDVMIRDLPNATMSGATTVCQNAPATNITFTGTGGTPPYRFTYRIGSGAPVTVSSNAAGIATVSIITTTPGTFHYELIKVEEIGGFACGRDYTNTVFADVEVKPLPTATIEKDLAEVCLNAATAPRIKFTGGSGTPNYIFTYNIDNGSGPGPNQTVLSDATGIAYVNVPTGTAGTYKYTLVSVQEGSSNTCAQNQTGDVSVTINPLPTADFSFAAPSCETRTISFSDISIPNAGNVASWVWSFGDPASGPNNTSTLQNPVHTFATANNYDVTLIVTTNKGCVSTQKLTSITINARPKAGFISPVACTSDINAAFTDTSKIATGTIVAWQWNFGDPASGPNNTSNVQNATHHYAVAGNYTATLIVTSNNGCKDTITGPLFVNGSVTTANFTVQNATTLCSNQDVSLTDASTVDFGNLVKLEVYWDFLGNPSVKTVDNNPVTGTVYTHKYPEFGSPFSKTYTVRYVVYSGATCFNVLTKTITVLATPTLQFNKPPAVCSDAPSFQLVPQVTNGLPGPAGVFSGTGSSATGLFDPSVGGGAYLIRYTFTGTNTCSNFIEQTIDINPTPGANAGPDKVVLEGGSVMLTPALNAGVPVTYFWSPPTGLSDIHSPTPTASPIDDVTYTLIVASDKGCRDTDYVFIKVLKKPLIPNIFSPNGDRIHDVWEIPFLESYPGCSIDIYNRYGQLIFHSIGYTKPWDGKVNGKDVPVGTYYYIVDPKNGRAKMSGYVDVIR